MTSPYSEQLVVRWADVDFNGHMKNTAYLDVCVDVRLHYFARGGFTAAEFARLRVGPVVRRDEVDYYRELRLLEPFTVDLELAGASPDGSRFRLQNRFRRQDGELVARVVSTGGWLDLAQRKLIAAPEQLGALLQALPRAEGFAELPSSVR
jgi:acyl-CoA thioester hydrolase